MSTRTAQGFIWLVLSCIVLTPLTATAEATCYPALPAPVLTITGTETYTDFFGTPFTRYRLNVTNYASIPAELFYAAPSLEACGLNTNSSRTWVYVFLDGEKRQGFCALASPSDLNRIWFAVVEGGTPPNSVYITLTDRQCGISYTSNVVPDTYGPVTTDLLVTPNPVTLNTSGIVVAATINDTTTGGSHITSAQYRIDGGTWTDMTVQNGFDSAVEYVTATFGSFPTADVREVCVHGTDAAGNTGPDSCVPLAIYDPNAGFVTGGGWITSPVGAYVAEGRTGRADFGFVSQYHNGATVPTGNTEFQFQAATLKFKSSSYDWLVVAGSKAQIKGTGTINGSGNFGFMLTAVDGNLIPGGVDTFRIKIWDKNNSDAVVYDNQLNDSDTATPSTALSAGSIVIRK